MKLNLLPKSAAKGVQSRSIFYTMLAVVLATLAVSFLWAMKTGKDLQSWKDEAAAKEPLAALVVKASQTADTELEKAKIVLTNAALVKSIDESNKKYPRLYDELMQYVPSFLRVRSITAASSTAANATITINGYLKSFQQYSDVMIALLRFPGCTAVGRSGFAPVEVGDAGPFGYNPDASDRGPIPGWSSVTLTMAVAGRDLQAPDARATLASAAGGGTPAPGQGGGTQPGVSSGLAGKLRGGG